MRKVLVIALALGLAGVAAAYDLGNQAPVKTPQSYPENIPDPERQGGDTIDTATVIPSLPYADTGTTAGYTDDYDEGCPDGSNVAPDVVYQYGAVSTQAVVIDLCGSSYDTKVYVYDGDLNFVACNDDYYFSDDPCGLYVSKLVNVPLNAGTTYYIVIDGYGASFGAYVLDIQPIEPCVVPCPAGGLPEGEPPLVDDYVDNYNGGCNTDPGFPFQWVHSMDGNGNATLCGVSGWYLYQGSQYRDTDWFLMQVGNTNELEVTGDAEVATYMFELGPQDCATVGVVQQVTVGPCAEGTMTITGYDMGDMVWFWAGPTVFSPPAGEDSYDYVLWFSGLEHGCPTETSTWSTVKALYE